MLENGAVVTDLLFHRGVADACHDGALVIDMSSIAPSIAEDHARILVRSGLRYIDAPVSGGTIGAEKGTLAIMAGGEEADILVASPILALPGEASCFLINAGDEGQKLELSINLELLFGHLCDTVPRILSCHAFPGSVTHLGPEVRILVQMYDCLPDFRGCLAQVKEETVSLRFDQLHILSDPAGDDGQTGRQCLQHDVRHSLVDGKLHQHGC